MQNRVISNIWCNLSISSKIGYIILALTIITFLYLNHIAYKYTKPINDIASIPLLRKSSGEVRLKPLNPGGVVFSHQDKEIYRNINRTIEENSADYNIKPDSVSSQIVEETSENHQEKDLHHDQQRSGIFKILQNTTQ